MSPGEARKHVVGQPAPHGITPLGQCGSNASDHDVTPQFRTDGGSHEYVDADATAAKLRGVEDSYVRDAARPSDPETVAYFLHLYGVALAWELEAPPAFRRWAESLSAETMQRAIGEAAKHDTEFRESVSYHEGCREPSWFTHAIHGVCRATIRAFIADPDSPLGALHLQCRD